MSIYVNDKRFGTFETKAPGSIVRTTWSAAGIPTNSTTSYPNIWSLKTVRSGKSSNAWKPILSGRALWRSPSSYGRTTALCTFDSGFWSKYNPLTGAIISQWSGRGGPIADSNIRGPYIGIAYNAYAPSNMVAQLNTEALLKLKDMKVNFGEALAESRSTVSHLARTGSSVFKAFISAKRGDWSGVAKALGVKPKRLLNGMAEAERWLEYQYGWMPLLNDAKGLYDLANEGFKNRGLIFSVSRTLTDSSSTGLHNLNWDIDNESNISAKLKIFASVDNAKLHQLTNLGLADPLQVGWALLPYSFVIDWFMPVGNMLEAVGATRGLTFVGGYYGFRVNSKCSWVYRPENQAGAFYEGEGFSGRSEIQAYNRSKLASFPLPSLYLKSPFSTTHVTSALALWRTAVRVK